MTAREARAITLADAEKAPLGEDREELVRLLLDWARDDQALYQRLLQYAARHAAPEDRVAEVRRGFRDAVRVGGFVPYREAAAWTHGVHQAIDAIQQLRADGHAAEAIPLCEWALQSVMEAIQSVDDSDGHFSTLSSRLEDIHHQACEEVRPDPAELARRLFDLEMESEFDVLSDAAGRYAAILGTGGIEAYRQLAEAEWRMLSAPAADALGSARRSRIARIMESLARASGDLGQLVEAMSHDLSSGYQYWRIVEVYSQAGQLDDALAWAEKGIAAFPQRVDPRLRDFAAAEYHRRKRHDDAMQLIWAAFMGTPYLTSYQMLEAHARKADAWPVWRDRALAEIRRSIQAAHRQEQEARAQGRRRARWERREADHSVLVDIYLYEGAAGDAWREAQAGGCADHLWLRLAATREEDHPEEAAAIYWSQAAAELERPATGRYEGPVELLKKAARAMQRAGRSAEFVRDLEELRARYRIKRNFTKLLERERSSLYLA